MSSIIDSLIFDRTAVDVARVVALAEEAQKRPLTNSELAEWNAAVVRGAYNAEDLNRIGASAQFANAFLSTVQTEIDAYVKALGVAYEPMFDAHIGAETVISPRTDYARDNTPIMRADVSETIHAATVTAARVGINISVDVSRLNFEGANIVERAIFDAYRHGENAITERKDKADRIAAAWYYSGDLICGEIR